MPETKQVLTTSQFEYITKCIDSLDKQLVAIQNNFVTWKELFRLKRVPEEIIQQFFGKWGEQLTKLREALIDEYNQNRENSEITGAAIRNIAPED